MFRLSREPIRTGRKFNPIRVTAACIYQNDMILICRRASEEKLAGYWEFPGGKVERGETDKQCLQRELYEELGIVTEVTAFIAENTHHYDDLVVTLALYTANILEGVPTPTVHDTALWIDPCDLLKWNLAPADLPLALAVIDKLTATSENPV